MLLFFPPPPRIFSIHAIGMSNAQALVKELRGYVPPIDTYGGETEKESRLENYFQKRFQGACLKSL